MLTKSRSRFKTERITVCSKCLDNHVIIIVSLYYMEKNYILKTVRNLKKKTNNHNLSRQVKKVKTRCHEISCEVMIIIY